ncbi:polyphosphate polymerase domain-containing protein [Stieleria sp. TO1_6]|uniref:polyphosphate polymerase domain-containing protein n=1 Tax=Stieleria tagensis TaxID=2956795 RepID=UPI00209AE8CC|nr:polyphosphate polymerase domain-containing protein [Stieleria tagensis]MCO8125443.1 polyphosphate polymerase domain-containing protein [Stieleria tagensis]
MASHDAIQSSRSELKFTIDEAQSKAIREYLSGRMRADPNSAAGSYPVCSVYLDSPDDLLYQQTVQGIRNRYKLRVRIYDGDPTHPAFLEIKSRDGRAVKKKRAKVDRKVATAMLSGETVAIDAFGTNSAFQTTNKDWIAFQEFSRLRDRVGARGTTYVYYQREAYVSPQNTDWRATFDRQLLASPYQSGTMITIPKQTIPTRHHDTVVFELKFTDRFPRWMQELVRAFNLISGPFPKYLTCRDSIVPTRNNRQLPPHMMSTTGANTLGRT